ncbi:type IV pilin protein [Pseudomonas indica]|jgi:type IV pilus assembly protein PilE|uniref:type IV pilin protein n=1 Tax=Pseudomonas indica TaxID=137658 RepID=UPI0023F97AE0|nr:type IV pilin protein [Pseudomonas indica]MBU3059512.1 type IV pilin protein [Pseudomonas indica]
MRRQNGFTLIEIMIVVVILAILATIAFPSYQRYVLRAHRAEGIALLNEAAAREERYYAQNNGYVTSDASLSKLGLRNSGLSDTGYYQLTLAEGDDDDGGYRLTAVAQGTQAKDSECANLTLTATGARGTSGTGSAADCWR